MVLTDREVINMIPIQNFYTGTNAGVILPDSPRLDRAVKDYTDRIFEVSKIALADAQRRQEQFLDYTDIKPMQAIAAVHQAKQAEKIAEFEKFTQDKWSNAKFGRLSTVDQMEIQNKKNEVVAWQQNLQANQRLYAQDQAQTQNEWWKWDRDLWNRAEQQFLETGIWDRNIALTRSPGNITSMFQNILEDAPTATDKQVDFIKDSTGTIIGQTESYSKQYGFQNTNELRSYYRQKAKGDSELLDSASKQFAKLLTSQNTDDVLKAKSYLDQFNTDDDKGSVSDQERKNAILEFAIDEFAPMDVAITTGAKRADKAPAAGIQVSIVNGIGGASVDKKASYTFNPVKQPAQINNQQAAPALVFTDEEGVNVSAGLFSQLQSQGYPVDQLINAKVRHIIGNEFEADITYPSKPVAWTDMVTGKVYPASVVTSTGNKNFGLVDVNGQQVMVTPKPLERTLTVNGKVDEIINDLYQRFPQLRVDYPKYIQEQYSKVPKVGAADNL